MVFFFRALLWFIAAIFAWGHPGYGWVWLSWAVLVLSGLILWRRQNSMEVFNQVCIPLDLALLSLAISMSGGLQSQAYILYGGEALFLTSYGTLRYSMAGSAIVTLAYGLATNGWDARIFWWRIATFVVYFLAAGALGREYRLTRHRNRESRMKLEQISQLRALQDSILSDQDIETVLLRLLEEARDMLRADVAYCIRTDASHRTAGFLMTGMMTPEGIDLNECVPPQTLEVTSSSQINRAQDPLHLLLEQSGMKSFIKVPLQHEEVNYGWMGMATTTGLEGFVSSEFVVQSLADIMSTQIRFQESQSVAAKRGQLLTIIERVGRIVNRNLEMGNLLQSLRQAVSEVLDTDSFFVALTLPDDPSHVLMQYLWDDGEEYPPEVFPIEPEGITGGVILTGNPLLLNGTDHSGILTGSRREPQGMIVVPLIHEGRTLGAISVQSYRMEYGLDDVEFLSAIASQASIAIRNAQMYQQTQEISLTDYLTGLGNSRRFNMVVQSAIELSIETQQSLSLILIDSDSLKLINDQFGHQAGDLHLQRVAQVIRDNIREDDIACRYAGDEFVIILPKSDAQDAQQVAERIRQEIELHRLSWDEQTMGATISVGVASYAPPMTADTLFQSADRAMYSAKQMGKNRVAIAT